jgi:L-ascorbate metabolism protein UlaG (beta-lactamase superfamily)
MEIKWYGHSCFRIVERGMASIVTDPFDHKKVGYSALKLKADVVTISQDIPGHNHIAGVPGKEWEIRGAGEYEIGGVFITAVSTIGNDKKNLVTVFDYGDLTVGHLGNISDVPKRSEIEAMGTVNIALVPVGGGNSLNAAQAAEVISLLEPGFVIPMHYKTADSATKLNALNRFLQEMGLSKSEEAEDSFKITKASIPEDSRVVVLSPTK